MKHILLSLVIACQLGAALQSVSAPTEIQSVLVDPTTQVLVISGADLAAKKATSVTLGATALNLLSGTI